MDSSSLDPIVGFSCLELVIIFGSLELVGLSQGLDGIILYFKKNLVVLEIWYQQWDWYSFPTMLNWNIFLVESQLYHILHPCI
jgi:hypothetical protein